MNGKKKQKIETVDVLAWAFAILVIIAVAIPFLYVIALSLSSSAAILQGRVGIFPVELTFDSYKEILKTPKILIGYKNSIVNTASAVVLALVLSVLTAYPLSRKELPGRQKLVGMIVFTMFFSGGMVPFYILMQNLHLMDNIWAIILPWAIPAFNLFLIKNYFENIPNEIYEAAVVDGASEYRILAKIYVPLGLPIFATIGLFVATSSWNDYMVPLMYLTSPEKYPLQLILQEMLIEDNVDSGVLSAKASVMTTQGLKNATVVLSILPLLICYPFAQKFFIGSIYAGSVKG